jgi:hypothetical protein
MRIDWVPFSASALVAGATALSVGALLAPDLDGESGAIRAVEAHDMRWFAVALLYFVASVLLTVGWPSVLTLFDKTGFRTCLSALAAFAMGTVGIAGYAMILGFLRALVKDNADLTASVLESVIRQPGFAVLLYSWIVAFYLGELLLGIALLRAKQVPTWIPAVLIAHVCALPVSAVADLPHVVQTSTALLITVGLAGVGIAANSRHALTR